MIKSELIAQLTRSQEQLSEQDVAECVNHILTRLSNELIKGGRIEIRGFGSFSLHFRAPRLAHNPKTGEKVITKAKHSPHFKPGKEMRERVDESKAFHPIKECEHADEESD